MGILELFKNIRILFTNSSPLNTEGFSKLPTKESLNNNLKTLLHLWKNDKNKILEYIEQNNTVIVNSKRLDVGPIPAQFGFEALKLNWQLFKKISLKSPAIFAINDDVDIYILIQQLHKWYFMQNGFKGFDKKSAELLKDISDNDMAIAQLDYKEVTLLRQAIARDVESINFVEKYVKECST